MSISYQFEDGAEIGMERDVFACYCGRAYREPCTCEEMLKMTVCQGSKTQFFAPTESKEITKLQKFLMKMWYELEKKKREQ